jgi:sulfur-oxidizing protein SoxY
MNRRAVRAVNRREVAAGALLALTLRPALATPEDQAAAIRAFTGGAVPREGRVELDIPPLVENGNVVPLKVTVQSPMTAADHVTAIALFNEKNPQPQVVTARFGPRAGRAELATHMRLATSQFITAVAAMSDGSFWSTRAEVIVTLAACIES